MSHIGSLPLSNKVVLVTGGGSGINLSFTIQAVSQGARVIIADLKLTSEASTFIKSSEAASQKVFFVKCDVTKRAELENLIVVAEKEFGDVPDIFVAGAGVFEPEWSNFWDDTEEDDYTSISINVTHPLKLARIAIRSLLRKNKKGVILIISSIAGYQGGLSFPLYCATKHAIVGFVRSMAELDRLEGIKICAVAPGIVHTPLWTLQPEKMIQFSYDPKTSITPERVAQDMLELIADPEGKYPGGTVLENSLAGTRVLGTWNIEEPPVKIEGSESEKVGWISRNYKPILEILEKERGAGGA